MTKDRLARIIGGVFGLVFIEWNASVLPPAVATTLRVVAVIAFLGPLALPRFSRRPRPTGGPTRVSFGGRYWLVVAIEAVALLAGALLINGLLHAPQATVAWIALVVGLHFLMLATLWHLASLRLLGAGMALCGAVGLVLAIGGSSVATIALISGIVPGALLIGSTWCDVTRPARAL